ncbi:MAG: DUF2807 domain-containing protein [Bacteroidales bacterium]|nr:DUF2807 domain-containing protein [Bacteroidales bacterium]
MRALLTFSILLFIHLAVTAQEFLIPVESPFEQVRVTGNIHLQLVASDTALLLFDGEAVPELLEVEWLENRLTLKIRSELKKLPAIKMKLHYTTLSGLEITRGAVVQSADTLKTKTLSLWVETGGKAEFVILTDSLSARVNQGADIILRGATRSQLINAYTVGNYLGYDLEADSSWVKAATGAQVKINSSKFLNANATSKAFVGYLGVPEQKEFKSSVGGKITQQSQ